MFVGGDSGSGGGGGVCVFNFLTLPVLSCALLNCESFMHVDIFSLFVFHLRHPRFPLK